MSPLDRPLFTVAEAADVLRISPDTCRRWIRRGRLPSVRLGNGPRAPVRVPAQAIQRLVDPESGRPPKVRDAEGDREVSRVAATIFGEGGADDA